MLYIHIIGKNTKEGRYVKYNDNYIAELRYNECEKHTKSKTASRIELLTPTGEILKSHDYE